MKRFFLAVIILIAFLSLNAQENFQGSIIFDIKLEGESIDPQMSAMMPKEVKLYMDTDKVCTEQKTMFSNQKVIIDAKEKMLWILMSMMGQNIAIHSTFDEMMGQTQNVDDISIEYLEEYKTIAGYKCQKVVMKNDESNTIAYVTDQIKGFKNMYLDNPVYNQMKGFILESTSDVNGINVIMSAREVKKEKVDASVFEIPDSYQKLTMTEFQSMMGGGY